MNQNQLLNLTLDELRTLFESFLNSQNLSKITVKTALSDAFYYGEKGIKISSGKY